VWQRFLLLSLPMLGLIALSGYFAIQSERETQLASVRMETAHHVESQAKNVRVELKQAVLHVKFLAKHSDVNSVLKGDRAHALDELNQDFHAFAQFMGVYDQVRLLDRHGHEVVRANFRDGKTIMTTAENLQNKSAHVYFKQAMLMPDQAVFISRFSLNIEHGRIEKPLKPVLRFAAPVVAENGEKLGVMVLNFLGKVLIDRYLDATDVRGENMLLNADSFFFHAEDTSSTWGSVLEGRKNKNLASRFPIAWAAIVKQHDGQVLTGEGLFTFATISPYDVIGQEKPHDAGAGDWIVVSYVACDELYEGAGSISGLFMVSGAVLFLLWLLLAWLWIRSEMQREQLLAEKRELLRLQMYAQEEERHKLARLLHDDMGQSLTSLQAYAAAVGKSQLDEQAHDGIQHIREITHHIQDAVRNQLRDLRPASLDRLGLCATLEDMLEKFAQREGVACDFVCEQQLLALSDEQNIHLFRIVQEALTNVSKYAQASHISLHSHICDDTLFMTICDDGCGMGEGREDGLGLLGMRERAELLHGTIAIESAPGQGVRIDVQIPLLVTS